MSKHNRDRRRLRCSRCGSPMWRELADLARRRFGPTPSAIVHVCGHCKTCHYLEGDRLRPLTPAELLVLHVEVPKAMAAIAAATYEPSDTPAGTLLHAKE